MIKTKLANLPDQAGVYIMLDADNNILYVGKAKNLKNRVRQYFFASTNKNEKVLAMLSHVVDFNYIICDSEKDALSLENTLIKKHTPPYNILLKDDKQYPYIKVDLKADFPKFEVTRKLLKDNCKYYGPITSGGGKVMLEILSQAFPTINCNHNFNKLPKNFRPCLNHHIGKCLAPCVGNISKTEYKKIVDGAIKFLEGDTKEVEKILKEKMQTASENLQYEQALNYRRFLEMIDKMNQQQIVVLNKFVDYDMFAIVQNSKHSVVNHTMIRGGKVIASDNIAVTDGGLDVEQTLESFLLEYSQNVKLSTELYTNVELDGVLDIQTLIFEQSGQRVKIACPKLQDKKRLVDMAYRNAVEYLTKSEATISKQFNSTVGAVTDLKDLLTLKAMPKRIECFDISNISGVDKVASMVVFTNGKKDSAQYRHFKIKTVEGANDFASMKEVLLRRFARLNANDKSFPKPDLIVVDGGMGQLKYAQEAMVESGVEVEMVALAEREELVYLPNNNQPIFLPRNSYALHLLVNIRDESHRFAVTHFRKLHGKNAIKSVLSDIEGVGQKRLITLQRHFKSIEALQEATVEDILEVAGINKTVAQNVYDFFHEEDKN